MKNTSHHSKKTTLIAIIIVIAAVASVAAYKIHRIQILDSKSFKSCSTALSAAAKEVGTDDAWMNKIKETATSVGLIPVSDEYGNIILTTEAVQGKESMPMLVLCTEYDVATAAKDADSIASALMTAKSATSNGPLTVIIARSTSNSHDGLTKVSSSYFPAGSNVIFLSSGSSTSTSQSSFCRSMATISLPLSKTSRSCDTVIDLSIGGIETGVPDSEISNQANPISPLVTLLTKMRKKSLTFEVEGVTLGSSGSLYPTSLNAKILVDSSSIDSVKEMLSKQREDYIDKNKKNSPDISFEFKVVDDESSMPTTVYSKDSTEALINFLYTIKEGTYKFGDEDTPKNKSKKDIYAINVIEGMTENSSSFDITVETQALNDDKLDAVMAENASAAALAGGTATPYGRVPAFSNKKSKLVQEIRNIYSKSNSLNFKDLKIIEENDDYFTPCSFIAMKNKPLDIMHISVSEADSARVTNTILNFLRSGNSSLFFS